MPTCASAPSIASLPVTSTLAPSLVHYRAPRWLPGGNVQTIWPALVSRRFERFEPDYQRVRWTTPDGDFVDVDFQASTPGAPWVVLFHGLEGSSRSHYATAFAKLAREAGINFAVPHFRGCSGELNLAPRAYHSGDFEEVGWMLDRFREHVGASDVALHAVGVSLGGNALLRWAQEAGNSARRTVASIAAVCSPIDLTAAGHAIGRGFNRWVYTRMFLRTMKPRALAKLAQHPGLFDREKMLASRDLYAFDDVFTGPLHGFAGVDDYWLRGSAKPHLARIRVPALVVNARNDPFVPATSLPAVAPAGDHVTLWQPHEGGHVGFPSGAPPAHALAMPAAVLAWLRAAA